MNKKDYLKDKFLYLIIGIVTYIIILLILLAFKVTKEATIAITITYTLGLIAVLLVNYLKKKNFYDDFKNKLNNLDQKYLIVEMLNEANFLEGKILTESLYEIDKSMIEKINEYKKQTEDYREYVELWIHEVKLPLSSLALMIHNKNQETKQKEVTQLTKIDNYLEQILYYVRSKNAEKDYWITEVNLSKIISNVAIKNKDILLIKGIDFIVSDVDIMVLTDPKWLEFIINQLIDNSIKYSKEKNAYIKLLAKEEKEKIDFVIYDNGIGISHEDLPRVFEKTFTGKNGHILKHSTGMGLYIVKNLCDKLGHKISIKSEEKQFTCVKISFSKNNFFLKEYHDQKQEKRAKKVPTKNRNEGL